MNTTTKQAKNCATLYTIHNITWFITKKIHCTNRFKTEDRQSRLPQNNAKWASVDPPKKTHSTMAHASAESAAGKGEAFLHSDTLDKVCVESAWPVRHKRRNLRQPCGDWKHQNESREPLHSDVGTTAFPVFPRQMHQSQEQNGARVCEWSAGARGLPTYREVDISRYWSKIHFCFITWKILLCSIFIDLLLLYVV